MFPPTEKDLAQTGECCAETTTQKDALPTTSQTLVPEASESIQQSSQSSGDKANDQNNDGAPIREDSIILLVSEEA
jgi:hypothetical protein